MKLVYSRNTKPKGNTSPSMEFFHVRDEPERVIHVLHAWLPRTLCGAKVSEEGVPPEIKLPNCGNCVNYMRARSR